MVLSRVNKFGRRRFYLITITTVFLFMLYLPYNFNFNVFKVFKPLYFVLAGKKEDLNESNGRYVSETAYRNEFAEFQLNYKKPGENSSVGWGNGTLVKPLCPFIPANLKGRVEVDESEKTFEILNEMYQHLLRDGGHWKPRDCQANFKVAIIVPYRDRDVHLRLFLNHMHKILPNQLIEYAIYIVEQAKDGKFNRGLLMNIGYIEALKDHSWDCFIFHDVDLVPLDDKNLYYCSSIPRHMSVAVNTFDYKLPYEDIFGGASAIEANFFSKINGFSNLYFGWGAEDDDILERIKHKGTGISRYPLSIGRYFMLLHAKDTPNTKRHELLNAAKKRFSHDGINSLQYTVKDKKLFRLYTWLLVSVNENDFH